MSNSQQYLDNLEIINNVKKLIQSTKKQIKDNEQLQKKKSSVKELKALKKWHKESQQNIIDFEKYLQKIESDNQVLWKKISDNTDKIETLRRRLDEDKQQLQFFLNNKQFKDAIPSLLDEIRKKEMTLFDLTDGAIENERSKKLREIDALNTKIANEEKTLKLIKGDSKFSKKRIPNLEKTIADYKIRLQELTNKIQDDTFVDTLTNLQAPTSKDKIPTYNSSNFQILDCGGGGDCFFRCIAQAVLGNSDSHPQVRQAITTFFRQNFALYSPFLVRNRTETPLEYIAAMSKLGAWVEGGAEILAAANIYNIRIFVHMSNNFNSPTVIVPTDPNEHTRDIHLLNNNQIHYQLLVNKK